MRKLIDNQLRTNDCGISAAKTVCNMLDVDITRDIIEERIPLDEEGASLESLHNFFEEYGFKSNYKIFDFNSIKQEHPKEVNQIFPCIVPIKKKRGLHYVVVKRFHNQHFEVLDPGKPQPYKLSIEEFKQQVYYSSSYLPYVDVEESLQFQVNDALHRHGVKIKKVPTQLQLTEMFNKIVYFSYVKENFGFKDEASGQAFLEDLIYRQELHHIPQHFREVSYKKEKLKIKSPVFLSIKKTASTKEEVGEAGQNVYWRLFKTIGSIKNLWYIFLATALLASFISYISVFVNQILIDHILPSYQMSKLQVFVVGVGLFFLIDKSFHVYKKYISIHLSNAFDRYFMKMFDHKLSSFSIRYLQSYKRGDLTERLSDAMRLKSFFTRYFSSIMVDLLIALVSLFFLFMINAKLTFVVFIVLILYTGLFYALTPIIADLERQRYAKKASFMSKFIEKIDGIQSIKALGLEAYSSRQILSSIEELITVQTKSKYVGMTNSILTSIISTFGSLSLLLLTAREMIVYNSMTLGMIVTFLALSSKIFSAFGKLLDKNLTLQEHKVILDRFFDFDERKENKEGETANQSSKKTPTSSFSKNTNLIRQWDFKRLSLKDVNFSYTNSKNIIEKINFSINKGEKIMIEGKNGSGKSTLCKVLGMLYKPSEGELIVNDIDQSLYDLKKLRSKIVFISGEDLLFNETFLFNISFGRKIDIEKLVAYAKALDIYDFIQKKPEKFDFVIFENGKNLSTGQRKKVLLLRALMTQADLIILDEIFNGMDKESKMMAEGLINSIQEKTFVVVSHMPTDNINFNKKYKIKNGQLLEQSAG